MIFLLVFMEKLLFQQGLAWWATGTAGNPPYFKVQLSLVLYNACRDRVKR